MELNVAWAHDAAERDCADRLLRIEVARILGSSPHSVSVARLCGACGSSRHGRPYVLPYGAMSVSHVSISRAGSLAMVAVTRCGPVGVDVACVRDFESDQLDEVLLHPAEHAADPIARARTWARKEALLKATGDGLRIDPRTIRVTGADEPPGLVGSATPLTTLQPRLYDVEVDEAHVACVCVLGRAPKRLSARGAALAAPVC